MKKNELSSLDRQAPLFQCTLLRRALDRKTISYQTPMVPLTELRRLVDFVKPLEEKEKENLIAYRKSLLPHPHASHMPLERFYAFASAVESIAHRKGVDHGDECRKLIYQTIQGYNDGEKGFGSAQVPRGGGPDKPLFTETTPKPREDDNEEIEEEDPFF